ncbi:hypothetical protein PALB_18100 [Pseudoalteromonas luteoviolacea B = ATCC 29581]|nr:hypothetical protein PALB_18100 [Pseudoalteromonas luteoviolacea B = ATCC 29581]
MINRWLLIGIVALIGVAYVNENTQTKISNTISVKLTPTLPSEKPSTLDDIYSNLSDSTTDIDNKAHTIESIPIEINSLENRIAENDWQAHLDFYNLALNCSTAPKTQTQLEERVGELTEVENSAIYLVDPTGNISNELVDDLVLNFRKCKRLNQFLDIYRGYELVKIAANANFTPAMILLATTIPPSFNQSHFKTLPHTEQDRVIQPMHQERIALLEQALRLGDAMAPLILSQDHLFNVYNESQSNQKLAIYYGMLFNEMANDSHQGKDYYYQKIKPMYDALTSSEQSEIDIKVSQTRMDPNLKLKESKD